MVDSSPKSLTRGLKPQISVVWQDLQVYFGDAAPLPPMDVGEVRLKAIEYGSG